MFSGLNQLGVLEPIWSFVKKGDFETVLEEYQFHLTGEGIGRSYPPERLRLVNTVTGMIIPGELLGGIK